MNALLLRQTTYVKKHKSSVLIPIQPVSLMACPSPAIAGSLMHDINAHPLQLMNVKRNVKKDAYRQARAVH
ncbi:Uncharacterised protein [Legionella pneumophila]|nr:Uncharacterised protein [Legionella pneumophila]